MQTGALRDDREAITKLKDNDIVEEEHAVEEFTKKFHGWMICTSE